MSGVRRIVAIVGALVLTLAIAVVAVAAGGPLRGLAAGPGASGGAPSDGPSQASFGGANGLSTELFDFAVTGGPGMGGDRLAQCQAFVSGLAMNLGIKNDALGEAVKKTLIQQIDAAQAAGKLNATQAQAAKDRVNAANNSDLCASLAAAQGAAGGAPGMGGRGGMGGVVLGGMLQGDLLNAAANYFGITPDALKQELASKGTLQAVAAAHAKDNEADKAGLLAALESALRASLTKQGVAADRIEQAVTMLKQGFNTLYTAPIGQMGQGGGGRTMPGGGPRGPRPSTAPSAAPSASPRTN